MAKSRFESAEQWNTKREIDRINRQIKQAYTKFGADSRLAKQYETILQDYLSQLYEYEKKNGVKLQAVQKIKDLSKGRWTSHGELAAMIATAKNAIIEENKKIVEDVFSQNQW